MNDKTNDGLSGLTDKLSNLQAKAKELLNVTDEQRAEAKRNHEKFQDALGIVEFLYGCSVDDAVKVATAIRQAHAFEKKYRCQ